MSKTGALRGAAQELTRRLGKAKANAGAMAQKASERIFENEGRRFRYIYKPARRADAPLLIVLHGRTRPPRVPTVKGVNWNILLPIDDHGFEGEGSWFLGEDGDFFWLDAMKALVEKVYQGDDIWLMGANMGGFGAIVHGLNLNAKGVYAHAPQTRLLKTAFGQQGLRRQIRTLFGRDSDNDHGDLRRLLEPGIATRFFLTARRWERAGFLAQQILPFTQTLTDNDIDFSLKIVPGHGNMPPASWSKIAVQLAQVQQGERESLSLAGNFKAADASEAAARAQGAEQILRDTFLDLPTMWGQPYPQMMPRFKSKLARYAKRVGIANDREAIYEHVRAVVEARRARRPRTFFVASPGGSGSHWFQQILSHNAGTVSCGEVYLPEPMMKALLETGPELSGLMIDAMHLVHAYEQHEDMSEAMLINTAHARGWRIAAHMPAPKTTILLMRDPYDVVMSRAFRKQGLRKRQFADKNDDEYLQQQIDYVHSFYEVRDIAQVDVVVRYEDLKRDIGATLRQLAQSDHMPIDTARIDATVAAFARGELEANKYRGPKIAIDERHQRHARKALQDLRAHLGYRD